MNEAIITDKLFNNILEIVIGIVFLSAFATTVISSTATGVGKNLENASATGKIFWGIVELLYPILGVGLMIDGLKKFMHK